MSKPKALRLADDLEQQRMYALPYAAAELRRLHEAHEWQHRMAGERLRRIEKLERIQVELVEALRGIVALWDHHSSAHGDGVISPLHEKARAALAKVEAVK